MISQLAQALRPPENPEPALPSKLRHAAIAAVLSGPPADPSLLFIRRAAHPGDPWSGHVALPGGGRESQDLDLRATAARETREEVGLDLALRGRLLGGLEVVQSPQGLRPPGVAVAPFVFHLPQRPLQLHPNAEVASVHWVALQRLLAGEGRTTFELSWKGQTRALPVIELDGLNIWGMTLRVVDDLLARLGA